MSKNYIRQNTSIKAIHYWQALFPVKNRIIVQLKINSSRAIVNVYLNSFLPARTAAVAKQHVKRW